MYIPASLDSGSSVPLILLEERKGALLYWIRQAQQTSYSEEYKTATRGGTLSKRITRARVFRHCGGDYADNAGPFLWKAYPGQCRITPQRAIGLSSSAWLKVTTERISLELTTK